MAIKASVVLGGIAIFATGIAVGASIRTWMAVPAVAPEETTKPAPADALALELAQIRAAIEELSAKWQADLESRAVDPTRRPVDGASSQAEMLAQAIDRLDALLSSRTSDSHVSARGGVEGLERWQGPGYASLVSMQQRVIELAQSAASDWDDVLSNEFTKAHTMWRTEDVLNRYGPPNRVGTTHGFGLIYDQYQFSPRPNETCWFTFDAEEGWVTNVWVVID